MNETAISGTQLAKIEAGSPIVGIVPKTIEEVFRFGELICQSGLAPAGLKTPQAVTVVLLKGLEIGMQPMAALESFGVINGRACIYGDGIPALLWSRGFDIEEGEPTGEGDERKATCTVTRPGGKKITRSFSLKQARTAGLMSKSGPWTQYPDRMLMMRARAFAARDAAADVLKGIPVLEEQRDIVVDVTPETTGATQGTVVSQIEDIPDEVTTDNGADQQEQALNDEAPWHAQLTDVELLDKAASDFATANHQNSISDYASAYATAIEERGLEQEFSNLVLAHKQRLQRRESA